MTLPKKEEKGYLEIQDARKGFVIVARKEDAGALAALFVQYGISCQRKEAKGGAEVAFQFSEGMERDQVESVREGYKTAKGSSRAIEDKESVNLSVFSASLGALCG